MSHKEPGIEQQLLKELASAWANAPELRLMQLLVNVIEPKSSTSELFYVEDSQLLKRLQCLNENDGNFLALHEMTQRNCDEAHVSDATQRIVLNAFRQLADTLSFSDQSRAQLLDLTLAQYEHFLQSPAKHYATHHNTLLLFLRMGRNLDAISGADEGFMAHWFSTDNSGVSGVPSDLCCHISGLEKVVQYLDAMKSKC